MFYPLCRCQRTVTFIQTSESIIPKPARNVGLTGLEPVTLRLSSACSNQLSYRPKKSIQWFSIQRLSGTEHMLKTDHLSLEARGFEPLTSSLQSWRSTN